MRHRMAHYLFVHCNALYLCTLSIFHCGNLYFHVAFFSDYTLFTLHFFHTALFSCCTFCVVIFLCCTFFCVALSLSHIALLHVAMFSLYILLNYIHSIFSCCTLFMVHYFRGCIQYYHKHQRWRALQQ